MSDVLRPERRVCPNELCHQLLAPRILKNLDDRAARSQKLFLAEEGPVLADDDPRNAVEENRSAAHRAGRERRVDRALAIDLRRAPAGVLERVHLAVEHDAPALHPPIVPAPEDASAMDEHRTDGNPALGLALGQGSSGDSSKDGGEHSRYLRRRHCPARWLPATAMSAQVSFEVA